MRLNKREITYLIILLGVSLFLFVFKLWSFGLLDVDEPRYAEAAREMIESNNWITPYFNYVVRFDKPVLFYWLIAFSYKIFGVTEFAARLPSALMALSVVIFMFFFGRKHRSAEFGFISALITCTSIEFLALARMSITDMTLSAFISLMLMSGFTAIHSEGKEKAGWWYAFYIFMALGMLTKGPVAPGLAVIVFTPYLLLTGKFRETFKTCKLITGSLLFLAIALPWYILVIMENGQPYIDQFFLNDNLKRFTSTVSGHKGPVWFFFAVIAVGFLPWSTFLPYALLRYLKPIINSYKEKAEPTKCSIEDKKCSSIPGSCPFIALFNMIINPVARKYKEAPKEQHLILFSLIWFLVIFIFFTASGTKLLTYILPLFPALGLIMGYLWTDYIEEKDQVSQTYMLISCGILVLLALAGSYIGIFEFDNLLPRDAKALNLGDLKLYGAIVFSTGCLLSFIYIFIGRKAQAFSSIIIMMVLVGFIALYGVLPKVYNATQGHLNKLINVSMNYSEGNQKILTFRMVKPSIIFYTKRRIEPLEANNVKRLQEHLNSPERIFIITKEKFLDELSKNPNVYIIDKGRRFALATNQPFDKNITDKLLKENK